MACDDSSAGCRVVPSASFGRQQDPDTAPVAWHRFAADQSGRFDRRLNDGSRLVGKDEGRDERAGTSGP